MSIKETNRIAILDKLINKQMSRDEAAKQLNLCTKQVSRLKSRYLKDGAKGLVHKRRGKPSNNKISQQEIDHTLAIVTEKYSDFGPTLAHEKLLLSGNVTFSVEKLRIEMIKAGLWKSKKRKYKKNHPLRERRSTEGELVQADGSPHAWFEDRGPICNLTVIIDDATGKLKQLWLSDTETTQAYFEAFLRYFRQDGIPLALYVDRDSVFTINNKDGSTELTQFARAMKELDVEVILALSPQAKGRVERVNLTLQDRLVKELRLLRISTIQEANEYFPTFVKEFNEKFAVIPKHSFNSHRESLLSEPLEEKLCYKYLRIVTKNLTVHFQNKILQLDVPKGHGYVYSKQKIEIRRYLNGEIKLYLRNKEVKYKIYKQAKRINSVGSKRVNNIVDNLIKSKKSTPKLYKFKIGNGTFLLGRK